MEKFEIRPKSFQKDISFFAFLFIWSFVLLGFAFLCVLYKIWFGFWWCIGLYLVGLLGAFVQVSKNQTFVAGDYLAIFENSTKLPIIKLAKSQPLQLSIENVDNVDGIEAVPTLNLWYWDDAKTMRSRYILGLGVSGEAQKKLMIDLMDFLNRNGFKVVIGGKHIAGGNTKI